MWFNNIKWIFNHTDESSSLSIFHYISSIVKFFKYSSSCGYNYDDENSFWLIDLKNEYILNILEKYLLFDVKSRPLISTLYPKHSSYSVVLLSINKAS